MSRLPLSRLGWCHALEKPAQFHDEQEELREHEQSEAGDGGALAATLLEDDLNDEHLDGFRPSSDGVAHVRGGVCQSGGELSKRDEHLSVGSVLRPMAAGGFRTCWRRRTARG